MLSSMSSLRITYGSSQLSSVMGNSLLNGFPPSCAKFTFKLSSVASHFIDVLRFVCFNLKKEIHMHQRAKLLQKKKKRGIITGQSYYRKKKGK